MAQTQHLGITLIEQSQSQKEVTANEAFNRLDALLNTGAIDKDVATPPGSPAEGDVYIVASGATDDWATHENDIAYYSQIWRFITPREGLIIWVNDEDALYRYDGSAWALYTQNLPLLGVNTTADTINKLAVSSDAVLFTTATGDAQIKVNKTAVGDTASYLFQTGFSGRAEFGLVGDDDFQLKVSANGSSFDTAFVVDKDSGSVAFSQFVGHGEPSELTIAAGAVTATQSSHTIDTESDAATDDLDTINGGNNGDFLYVSAANAARTVVFKDGTGNLRLAGDFSANHSDDMLVLQKRGGNWLEISRSDNS